MVGKRTLVAVPLLLPAAGDQSATGSLAVLTALVPKREFLNSAALQNATLA